MWLARAITWLLPGLVIAMGAGFVAWSVIQSGDADAYRKAPQCGTQVSSGCYELFPGRISSVEVSQGREGERDSVTIDTSSHGRLTAVLMPSASEAPHVRTGAAVTVQLYRGKVTLVEVDGLGVASTANPAANQGNTALDGWLLIAVGVGSGVFSYAMRGRRERQLERLLQHDAHAAGSREEVLRSGEIGWSARPKQDAASLVRYAAAALLLAGMTLPALVDPARRGWAMVLDGVVVGGMVVLLGLFRHNSRVFANRHTVGKTDLFGRTARFDREVVFRADRFVVGGGGAANRHLVFVKSDGSKAFEVAGPSWDFEELDGLCRSAGIKLTGSYLDVVGAFKVNRRIRGTQGWSQVWMGIGLVVFIIAFALVLTGPTSR